MTTNNTTMTDSVKQSVNNDSNNDNEKWVVFNPSKCPSKIMGIIERNTVLLEEAIDNDENEDVITEFRGKVNEWMIKGGTVKRLSKISVNNGDMKLRKITIKNTPSEQRDYFLKLLGNNNG